MTDANDYCQRLVRDADRDRYLSTLFAPKEKRTSLFALFAFHTETGRVRDAAREPMAGEIRLQWWRDVLTGERDSEAAAHPVAASLLQAIGKHNLSREVLLNVLEARSFDLYDDPITTLEEFTAYANRTQGAITDLACDVLGVPALQQVTTSAAFSFTAAKVLSLLPRHASRRRLFVPLELLQKYAADPEELFAGQVTENLRAAFAEMRLLARRNLDAVQQEAAGIPQAALPALLPLAVVRPELNLMERDYDPLHPPRLPGWRRQWLIWRAARNPRRIA